MAPTSSEILPTLRSTSSLRSADSIVAASHSSTPPKDFRVQPFQTLRIETEGSQRRRELPGFGDSPLFQSYGDLFFTVALRERIDIFGTAPGNVA